MSRQAAVILCFAMLAATPASAQRMYKCVDARGKVYYTQLPPSECLGRETQELNKSGTVVRRNEVPVRAVEKAQSAAELEAERKRKQAEQQKAEEERRQSAALLNTYFSEKDIDDARGRVLKENEDAVKETEKRIQAALKRQKELDSEKEFYVKKGLPKKLVQDIQNIEIELKTQQQALDARRKQASTINAKYDDDKRRYLELTRTKPAAQAGGPVPASAKK